MIKKGFFSDEEKNASIKEVLEKLLVAFGPLEYAYVVMDKKNPENMIAISNVSDFFKVYFEKKYQNIDPIVIKSLNNFSSFKWDENIRIAFEPTPSRVFELAKEYNILYGYSFVLHDPYGCMAVLSFASDRLYRPELDELFENSKEKLHWILVQIHEMLLQIYKNEQNSNEKSIKELTSREMEILYWSSIGNTYPEVARILGLSVSTVKFHMANVVKKMGVKNAKHAIRLCAELDLISPSYDN
ncbi:helix-turn-helix transcriptional regulator [Pantoea cypripedii]|uniref:LuxR family transcriptional regulator n=1 Tax=Pantoea cypripedii TaxID=55209 RepID=A0A6B9GCB6_PANCY|nr:LuxR family transcriptional regulator [Pantoea cypripedii]QGY30196.1 LuxR family transcriptional regulator [Pantoea cypripedii]